MGFLAITGVMLKSEGGYSLGIDIPAYQSISVRKYIEVAERKLGYVATGCVEIGCPSFAEGTKNGGAKRYFQAASKTASGYSSILRAGCHTPGGYRIYEFY